MNGHRTKLLRLLGDAGVGAIVVEHRDRLGRMNTELVDPRLARRAVLVGLGYGLDDSAVGGWARGPSEQSGRRSLFICGFALAQKPHRLHRTLGRAAATRCRVGTSPNCCQKLSAPPSDLQAPPAPSTWVCVFTAERNRRLVDILVDSER